MHVQWWLIVLAFALGMVLTFVLMIRRVKSEAPVETSTSAASAGGGSGLAGGRSNASTEAPTTKIDTDGDTEVDRPH